MNTKQEKGGEKWINHVSVTKSKITLDSLVKIVEDDRAGAISTFSGTTRFSPLFSSKISF